MSLVSKGVEGSREKVAFKVDDVLTKTQPWGSAGGSFGSSVGWRIRKRRVAWNEVTDLKSHQTSLISVV